MMHRLLYRASYLCALQVAGAIEAGAAGAISGSAIVKIIEKNVAAPEQMLAELKAFVSTMKAATRS
ncbi:tryptophan synthase subunit alpha [Shigella flexneri]